MENKKNIFKALADFQQNCPVLLKETDGYGYKYVKLDHIIAQINPLLKKYNLGFTQLIEEDGLTTIVFHHPSGESLKSHAVIPESPMKGMNAHQSKGSGITYFRRYMLSSILGIISDADTDAKAYTTTPKKTIPDSKEFKRLVTDFQLDTSEAIITETEIVALEFKDKNWNKVVDYMNNHEDAKGKSLSVIMKKLHFKYTISTDVKKQLAKALKS